MKRSIKKMPALLTMMAVAIFAFTFTACSNDNEPKTMSGEEIVEWIDQLLSSKKNSLYVDDSRMGYALTVGSKEDAHKFVESLIRTSWDGKNTIITIPDGCGTIALSDDSNNGGYYLLSFRNVGYLGSFTLYVASSEFLLNRDNYFPPVFDDCPLCGSEEVQWEWRSGLYQCLKCGHKFDY